MVLASAGYSMDDDLKAELKSTRSSLGGKDGGFHGTVEHVNEVVDRGYAPFSGQHIRVWSCCGIQTATRRRKLGEA